MKRLTSLFVTAITLTATQVEALTGNDALNMHRGEIEKQIALLSYVRGAIEGERAFEQVFRQRATESEAFRVVWAEMAPKMFCPPQASDTQQAYDLLINLLQANPEQRHLRLATHLRVALRRAWPCSLQ